MTTRLDKMSYCYQSHDVRLAGVTLIITLFSLRERNRSGLIGRSDLQTLLQAQGL